MNESPLNQEFNHHYDLLGLFLGGNDIAGHPEDCAQIICDLKGLLLKCKTVAREAVFVLLERRHYP